MFSKRDYNCPCCNDRVWVYGIGSMFIGAICLECQGKHGNVNKNCHAKKANANKMNYIIINGSNGANYSIKQSCKAGEKLNEYNDSEYTINAVALGPSNRYAVCNSLGGCGWAFNDSDESGKSFHSKMNEMDTSEIKQVN